MASDYGKRLYNRSKKSLSNSTVVYKGDGVPPGGRVGGTERKNPIIYSGAGGAAAGPWSYRLAFIVTPLRNSLFPPKKWPDARLGIIIRIFSEKRMNPPYAVCILGDSHRFARYSIDMGAYSVWQQSGRFCSRCATNDFFCGRLTFI